MVNPRVASPTVLLATTKESVWPPGFGVRQPSGAFASLQLLDGMKAPGTSSNREKQMTSGASRLVRPATDAQRSTVKTAASRYCQVVR